MRRLAYFCGGFAAAIFGVVVRPQCYWYGVVCALLVALLLWRKLAITPRLLLIVIGGGVGLCYGMGFVGWFSPGVEALAGDTHTITAQVTQWPEEGDYGYFVQVSIQMEDAPNLTACLYVDEVGESLQPGDTIHTIARLYDASVTDTGEYTTYYISQGILLTGTCYGAVEVQRPQSIPLKLYPIYWVKALQQGIVTAFSQDTAPVIAALVTGDQTGLEDGLVSAIRRTGLSHTVVVSGMHMAFLAGVVTLLLGANRRRTALTIIPVAIAFAVMVGATPSILRAAIMIIMLQLAPLFRREADGMTSLLFALLLILMGNPYAIAHVGLQLSFASLVGIFCFTNPIYRWILAIIPKKYGRKGRMPHRLLGGLMVTIAAVFTASFGASIFTTPIIAYYFETVSLIAMVGNLLVLWVVSWCFVGGLLSASLAVVSPLAGGYLAWTVEPFVRYYIETVTALGKVPFAALPITNSAAVGWLVVSYMILACWAMRPSRLHPLVPLTALVMALAMTIGVTIQQNCLGDISVTVLDVGQGQSVYLRMGETTALVDCGGSEGTVAGDTAADAIMTSGHMTLDYLILTHCHMDHAGGVAQLMERMDIGVLVLPVAEGMDEGLRSEILTQADLRDIPVLLVDGKSSLETQSGVLTLFPPLGDGDDNERGLSVLTTYGSFDALITGDMGEDSEKQLVYSFDLPQVELYVAGHHGSQYSSGDTLLDAISPEMTAISVGTNIFGHPAQQVLDSFQERNITVYRTDTMGDITFRVGG